MYYFNPFSTNRHLNKLTSWELKISWPVKPYIQIWLNLFSCSKCKTTKWSKWLLPLTEIIQCQANPNCPQANDSIRQATFSVTHWAISQLSTINWWLRNAIWRGIPTGSRAVKARIFWKKKKYLLTIIYNSVWRHGDSAHKTIVWANSMPKDKKL